MGASPIVVIKKRVPVYDENGNRRRIRRKPEELVGDKNHVCPYSGCEKTYTSKCSLYLHIKRNHAEDEDVKDGETAPLEQILKLKKESISTRFLNNPKLKNTNAGLAKSQPKITLIKKKAPFQTTAQRSLRKPHQVAAPKLH